MNNEFVGRLCLWTRGGSISIRCLPNLIPYQFVRSKIHLDQLSDIFMPHAAVDTIRADNDSANCVIAMHCRLSEGMQCLVGKCCFLVLLLILATGLYFITTFFKMI